MKREGQGEGGVYSQGMRRNGEQRCGCKSTGQHERFVRAHERPGANFLALYERAVCKVSILTLSVCVTL